ncbi:uncharacterized protein HHUB_2196 [Halobacterium hubeiense]|uniref:Uncharacterized protein n=1 Tax=Halobacterium hubeiense TaxID=1407499 RepID=A0A0U5H627_9EURY|nr:hypothetical protein [Halobacterium hubeiense]CQH55191.1 uncharacterized protein HHUB_2196 [Halobacterium hubeiense]
MISDIRRRARRSRYIDEEHLLTLAPGFVVFVTFVLDVRPLIDLLIYVVNLPFVDTISSLSLQGLVAAMVTHFLYNVTSTSFQIASSMQTKERAMIIVVGAMLIVGSAVDIVIPEFVSRLSYPGVQVLGLDIALLLYYVHALVDNWKLVNEWPHLIGALLLVFGPQFQGSFWRLLL